MDDDVKKARESGLIAHLTKPIDVRRLRVTIGEMIPDIRRLERGDRVVASCRPRLVQVPGRLGPALDLPLAQRIQSQPALDRPPSPHPVHRLLHLLIPTVPIPPEDRVESPDRQFLVPP